MVQVFNMLFDFDDFKERLREPIFFMHVLNTVLSMVTAICIGVFISACFCGDGFGFYCFATVVCLGFLLLEYHWDRVSHMSNVVYMVQILFSALAAAVAAFSAFTVVNRYVDKPAVIGLCALDFFSWTVSFYLLVKAYRADGMEGANFATYQEQYGATYEDPVTHGHHSNSPVSTEQTEGVYNAPLLPDEPPSRNRIINV